MDDLRSHILGRLLHKSEGEEFSPDEIDGLCIRMDRLYRLKVLRVNYTTYDLRRATDTINSTSHPDVILLSGDSGGSHPYSYARVIGVFHADIAYTGQRTSSIKYEIWRVQQACAIDISTMKEEETPASKGPLYPAYLRT